MPKHLETPEKGEVKGAMKVLELLERSGKYSEPQKLQTITDALHFLSGKGQTSKILSSDKTRRTFVKG